MQAHKQSSRVELPTQSVDGPKHSSSDPSDENKINKNHLKRKFPFHFHQIDSHK